MKKMGRTVTPLTSEQKQAVTEYLDSNLSLIEVAEKYGITKSGLAYWLKKYRKEQYNNNGEENNNGGKNKPHS